MDSGASAGSGSSAGAPSASASPASAAVPARVLWAGRVMSALPVLMLLMSAAMKFMKPPEVAEGFTKMGIPESLSLGLGILELACTAAYVFPRTAVLGAILLTGYLGGAVLTHLRVGEAYFIPVVLGVFIWGGLYLRDPRIRALIPFKR